MPHTSVNGTARGRLRVMGGIEQMRPNKVFHATVLALRARPAPEPER